MADEGEEAPTSKKKWAEKKAMCEGAGMLQAISSGDTSLLAVSHKLLIGA